MTPLAFLMAAAVGACARFYVVDAFVERFGSRFPWGTIAVNLSGSFALGLLAGLGLYHGLSADVRTAVGTGGMGAYTTFSAFTCDTIALVEGEHASATAAARNITVTIAGSIAAAGLGIALASLGG